MELGEALWAAFKEVEKFYNYGEKRAIFRRYYISEIIPESMQGFFAESSDPLVEETNTERKILVQKNDPRWDSVAGTYIRSYDAASIAQLAWALAGLRPSDEMQVVVTDLVLNPPRDWRYVIWDRNVISIAPTDPKYWNLKESNRNDLVKHRVRTACLSIVGELIGLERCDNERCFLFKNVDSVTRLDDMVVLGPEHNIEALTNRGFEILATNPADEQDIKENPKTKAELR